ncbi:MAG: hypothetical protein OER90_05390 [Gemmatimonadota bacterium]|nr:hypothetical protein [Gemmatimonadota bacterium]
MRGEQRYAWTLGALDGIVVMGVMVALYSFLSTAGGWEFYGATLLFAGPFGIVTAWRGATFVRRLRSGKATPFRGPLEGFILAFGVALLYLVVNILKAHLAGAEPHGWGWPFWRLFFAYSSFYSVIAGLVGAVTGAALEMLNVLLVEIWPPRKAT